MYLLSIRPWIRPMIMYELGLDPAILHFYKDKDGVLIILLFYKILKQF